MAKRPNPPAAPSVHPAAGLSGVEALLLAAQARGDHSLQTGRYLVTYKEGAVDEGLKSLKAQQFRTADARDFRDQAIDSADIGDAEAVVFPEIGVALLSGDAFHSRDMSLHAEIASDSPVQVVEHEYFVFCYGAGSEYLRGFLSAAETIARDLGDVAADRQSTGVDAQSLGATWGLLACNVLPSARSGLGVRVAVLDTGMDLSHPDFAGRAIVTNSFVGQPVQDLHSHGTHCIGTSCGPLAPVGPQPRYGIAHKATIYAGKVLTNSGSGTSASVLAGMNWAIANKCAVISMSLGSQSPVQAAYTAAGNAALNSGCLIIAAAGNFATNTGAPANSPTILSVASLDEGLTISSFSDFGKVDIAAPGGDVFSSLPMPARYGYKSGTSMAAPHVAGCAALWAESSPSLRGLNLWNKLGATAKPLPWDPMRIGRGLVQAP